MKRRRKGGKRGKAKKTKTVKENEVTDNVVPSKAEENPVVDQSDNDEVDSGAEAESPSSVADDLPESSLVLVEKHETVNPTRPSDDTARKSAYGRVKVKIKTSKALDSQRASSDAPTQSDTDKSSQHVELENQGAASEKMEDSANSFPESTVAISINSSKKSGSIKIKSSRGFSSSSISPCSNVEMMKGEYKQQKDQELPIQESQYDKQQLDASLEVIKKIMKMDAAEPFNVPVDPIALGIPDYFDVIDTPMDFGTICSNLESGTKYMNSEDVYHDVQYIWDNCFKYNNKGDYILELMKRVKKNFMKYWTAAGLYCDHTCGNSSSDTVQVKDIPPSTDGVISVKSGLSTPATKKHHGLKKHKDGCLCAICVMMRRRQEREENARMLDEQFETSEDYMDEDVKQQKEASPMGSPAEYTSKNMENNADAHLEQGGKMKLDGTATISRHLEKPGDEKQNESMYDGKEDGKISEQAQLDRNSRDENCAQKQLPNLDSVDVTSIKAHREETPPQRVSEALVLEKQKTKESLDRSERAQMYERLRYMENPMLFELCGALFDDKKRSVWSGPHSLVQNELSTRKSTLLSTIKNYMK